MNDTNVEWFRRRLIPFATGLLGDEEEQRFRRLMIDDAACAELYTAFNLDDTLETEDAYHVPPDVIARWDVARTEMRGLEREMVVQHLSQCAECREDLELLGFSPALDAAQSEAMAAPGPGILERLVGWISSFFSAPARWIPAALVAATVLLLLVPRGSGPAVYLADAPPEATPTLTLTGATRSFDIPTIEIEEGTARVAVDVSQLMFYPDVDPMETILVVTLVDPEDTAYSLGTMNAAEFIESIVIIGNASAPILTGLYRLEMLVTASGHSAITRDLPFEVVPLEP